MTDYTNSSPAYSHCNRPVPVGRHRSRYHLISHQGPREMEGRGVVVVPVSAHRKYMRHNVKTVFCLLRSGSAVRRISSCMISRMATGTGPPGTNTPLQIMDFSHLPTLARGYLKYAEVRFKWRRIQLALVF